MKPHQRMTAREFAVRIGSNSWNWGLHAFANRLHLEPESESTKAKFQQFQDLAKLLSEFSEDELEVFATP